MAPWWTSSTSRATTRESRRSPRGSISLLREVAEEDLATFFEQQLDPEARALVTYAGDPPATREAFLAKWAAIRANETVRVRTVVSDGRVAGYLTSFLRDDVREVGYWLGREFWGKGLATRALREFLAVETRRPLAARVAKHNAGSLRVVQKCGFTITGEDRWQPHGSAPWIAEWVLTLA